MSLKILLPAALPQGNFTVEIQLRRIPEKSGVVKPRLELAGGTSRELNPVFIYGRGPGSAAQEKVHLLVQVEAGLLREADARGRNTLSLAVEDMEGRPISEAELDVESITVKDASS
jgi:hypothetical protein